ncbi:MAG: DnaJ domain-containing protein [Desulfocapsaceae bacterium]|nr:DnaJ domain-containing protein [Desulfocapsaceae bacterium]
MPSYQQHKQPGCGGCLLLLALIILITGGAPALLNFVGVLLYSGLAGVLLFIAIFWGFTYWVQKKVSTYEASQSESHNRFVWLLIQILINIAKIDGKITKEEISTIQRFFQYNLRYSQDQMFWVKDLIKDAVASTQSLESLLQEFRTTFAYEPRLILLELVYQILYTKSEVPEAELTVARNIAAFLQISAYDQRTIEAKYMYRQQQPGTTRDSSAHYYAVLGLEPGADMEMIKKAYRTLSMKYHPDKVVHLGEEFRRVAEEKMKEINVAYEYFKKR